MDKIGNDGLTDAERAEYARRWAEGAGKVPTAKEARRTAKLLRARRLQKGYRDARLGG